MQFRRVMVCGLLLGAAVAGMVVIPASSEPAGAARSAPIDVGAICSCTGPEASAIAQTRPELQAWARYVDAHGGIDGHPVKLTVKDDAYNPGTALAEAESLVHASHIVALVDLSDVDSAFSTYMQNAHIPVIGSSESAPGYQNPDFFTQGETLNYTFSTVFPAALKKAHIKKVAYLYCSEVSACASTKNELVNGMKGTGLSVSYTAAISASAPSYTAQCLAAKQSGAKAMIVGDASAVVTTVVGDCSQQGYTPHEYGNSGTVSGGWLKTPGFKGAIFTMPNYPWYVHNKITKPMYTAYRKYAPQVLKSPNFGSIATTVWAQGIEVEQAAKLGHLKGKPSSSELLRGLYHFHGNNLDGMSGPLTFHKNRPSNNGCIFYGGVKNKKFDAPYGLRPFCYTKKSPPH